MTKVEMGKVQSPKLPDRCVRCGKSQPGGRVQLYSMIGGWQPANPEFFNVFAIEFPTCKPCKNKVRFGPWFNSALTLVLAIIFSFIWMLICPKILGENPNSILWGLGMVISLIMGFVISESVYSPSANIVPIDQRLIFYFHDEEFAREFARVNTPAAIPTAAAQ